MIWPKPPGAPRWPGPSITPKPYVLLQTGSPASGKSTGLESIQEKVGVKRETLMTDPKDARQMVVDILDSGRRPVIAVTFLDSPAEQVTRMIGRALGDEHTKGIGRIVPIPLMAKTLVSIPKTVADLQAEFLRPYSSTALIIPANRARQSSMMVSAALPRTLPSGLRKARWRSCVPNSKSSVRPVKSPKSPTAAPSDPQKDNLQIAKATVDGMNKRPANKQVKA